jgi:cyclic pyranopterin phosphate synthase
MARTPQASQDPAVGGRLGDRLHLCVGPACNNNCLFCIEDNREVRFGLLGDQTGDDVRRMLAASPPAGQVVFVSAEPTLNPALPEYIRMARDAGFPSVGVITNGRRLAYLPYARALLEAGLDTVQVSIHGPDARTHDALTRSRGSFVQTVAGLANLLRLRADFPALQVNTAYCVNRRNLAHVQAFLAAMEPLRIDQFVFNVVTPEGRAAKHFDRLVPRASDVVDEFARLAGTLAPDTLRRVYLLDLPPCATARLPRSMRGWVERYFAYEMDGTCPLPEWGDGFVEAIPEGELFRKDTVQGDRASYTRVAKDLHDSLARVKRPECGSCVHAPSCPGIVRLYVDRNGWDEFVPVLPVPGPEDVSATGTGSAPGPSSGRSTGPSSGSTAGAAAAPGTRAGAPRRGSRQGPPA